MNNDEPYVVNLRGNESKRVVIETDIDVSQMESHIESGSTGAVHILIKSGDKSREL
jgi:hypothetical protein